MEKRLIQQLMTGIIPVKMFFALIVILFVFILVKNLDPNYGITGDPPVKTPPQIPTVTIDSIFEEPGNLSALEKEKVVTIIATGDVIPARGANWPAVTKNDFTYNWKKVAHFLKEGDITLINLEAPLIRNCPLMTEGVTFCGDSRHTTGINHAGVDTVSLANNHIGNFGQAGINETISLLKSKGIG